MAHTHLQRCGKCSVKARFESTERASERARERVSRSVGRSVGRSVSHERVASSFEGQDKRNMSRGNWRDFVIAEFLSARYCRTVLC